MTRGRSTCTVIAGNNPTTMIDPTGHFLLTAILVGAGIGALFGFGSTVVEDYADDGHIFNGSVSARQYIGRTVGATVTGAMVPMTGGSSTAVKILGTALAGAMGDTTDQIISNGKVDVVRTIKSGLMSAATAAAGAVISKAVSSTAGRTLYNSKGDASPGKAQEQSKPKVKTYQTYTKTNIKTGEVYSGRTSGYGSPSQNVAARDINHHMNSKGFGPAVLDRSSTNAAAIRGR